MSFALPNSTAVNTYAGYWVWANNTVEGVLTYGVLMIILAIIYFGTRRYGAAPNKAILVGLFACTLVGGAFTIMGAMSSYALWVLAMSTMLAYIYSFHT